MRFYTVPDAAEARRSVVWAVGSMSVFYLATLVIGYGASALVGSERILSARDYMEAVEVLRRRLHGTPSVLPTGPG